jgi:hypothetical protein
MYYDLFTHDQPSTVIPVPSHGNDFLALAGYQEDEELHLSFRYKRKETPSTIQGSDAFGRSIQQVVPRIQKNYRVNGEYTSSESWRVSSRIEWLTVDYGKVQTSGKGLLLAQAIKWNIWHSFVLQARLAIFDSDSYDSAVYEIEDDVPGAFSNPALFGRGIRWYIIFRCQPFPSVNISVKYSQTVKDGVKSLGSGLDEIKGNTQSMVNIQTEVRF